MEIVLTPLIKSVVTPLELAAASLASGEAI